MTTRHLVGADTGFDPSAPAEGPAVFKQTLTVPADSMSARVGTFGSDYPAGTDLDLFLYVDGELAAASAGSRPTR